MLQASETEAHGEGFDSLKELLQVYLDEHPANDDDHSDVDSNDDEDKPPSNDEASGSSGGVNLDLLAEALSLVMESDADAGSDANTTEAVEADEVANPDEDESVIFGSDSSLNAGRFEAVLESETLSDIIVASEKAIHGLHLKEREREREAQSLWTKSVSHCRVDGW